MSRYDYTSMSCYYLITNPDNQHFSMTFLCEFVHVFPIIIIHAMIIVLHGMKMIQNVHIFRKIILVNDLLNASFH